MCGGTGGGGGQSRGLAVHFGPEPWSITSTAWLENWAGEDRRSGWRPLASHRPHPWRPLDAFSRTGSPPVFPEGCSSPIATRPAPPTRGASWPAPPRWWLGRGRTVRPQVKAPARMAGMAVALRRPVLVSAPATTDAVAATTGRSPGAGARPAQGPGRSLRPPRPLPRTCGTLSTSWPTC